MWKKKKKNKSYVGLTKPYLGVSDNISYVWLISYVGDISYIGLIISYVRGNIY